MSKTIVSNGLQGLRKDQGSDACHAIEGVGRDAEHAAAKSQCGELGKGSEGMGRGAALRGAERGIGAVDSIIAEIMDIAAADKGTGVNGYGSLSAAANLYQSDACVPNILETNLYNPRNQ